MFISQILQKYEVEVGVLFNLWRVQLHHSNLKQLKLKGEGVQESNTVSVIIKGFAEIKKSEESHEKIVPSPSFDFLKIAVCL